MTAYPSLNLPRFSGSTLEPTVEPVAFVPSCFKRQSTSSVLLSPSLSSVDSSSSFSSDDEYLPPTSSAPSFSLNRPNRPTYIDIPATCKVFTMPNVHGNWSAYDPQERSCQTQPEFEWNENEQTVYKRPSNRHRYPDPTRHIFWSA
ncbi:unnamed protein product [Absidia cylindrospora]